MDMKNRLKIARELVIAARSIIASNYQFGISADNKRCFVFDLEMKPIVEMKNLGDEIEVSYFTDIENKVTKISNDIRKGTLDKSYSELERDAAFFNMSNTRSLVPLKSFTTQKINKIIYKTLFTYFSTRDEKKNQFAMSFSDRSEKIDKAKAYSILVETYHTSRPDAVKFIGEFDQSGISKMEYAGYTVICKQENFNAVKKVMDNAVKYIDEKCRYGEVEFTDELNGGSDIFGDYSPENDTIRVKMSSVGMMVYAFVHENAHRFWNKFATQKTKELMKTLWNDVRRENNPMLNKHVIYNGEECTVLRANSKTVELKYKDGEKVQLHWLDLDNFYKQFNKSIQLNFPSDYSRTNLDEFKAECLTIYQINKSMLNGIMLTRFENVLNGTEENEDKNDKIILNDRGSEIALRTDDPLYHGSQFRRYVEEKTLGTKKDFEEERKNHLRNVFVIDARHKKIFDAEVCFKDFSKYSDHSEWIERDGLDDMRDYLNCTQVQRVPIGSNYAIYVDEEGALKEYGYGFQFKGKPWARFVGNGVIVKEGGSNLKLSVETLNMLIEFVGQSPNDRESFGKFTYVSDEAEKRLEELINRPVDKFMRYDALNKWFKDPSQDIPDLETSSGYDCSKIKEYMNVHAGEKTDKELLYDWIKSKQQEFIQLKHEAVERLEHMREERKKYEEYQESMGRRKSDKPVRASGRMRQRFIS